MCSLITPIDFPDLLLQGSSQVERKKKREGFAAGAPIDTADEGLHCTAKPPLQSAPRLPPASFFLQKPFSKCDSSVEYVTGQRPRPPQNRTKSCNARIHTRRFVKSLFDIGFSQKAMKQDTTALIVGVCS